MKTVKIIDEYSKNSFEEKLTAMYNCSGIDIESVTFNTVTDFDRRLVHYIAYVVYNIEEGLEIPEV